MIRLLLWPLKWLWCFLLGHTHHVTFSCLSPMQQWMRFERCSVCGHTRVARWPRSPGAYDPET